MKRRVSLLCILLVSFLAYFFASEHLFATVLFPGGDEPYYLLIAHSLVHDGDFELSNNFANEDYRAFYPLELTLRHEAVTPKPILVSKHSLGLPLLIAPGYALAGWYGAAHTLNLVGALLALNIFMLAYEVTGRQRVAWIVWAALAFAAPLSTYAGLIFPEAPAALLVIYAFRQLRRWDETNVLQKFLTGLCLAYLPWLHARFLFVVFGLFAWMLYQYWQKRSALTTGSRWALLLALAPLLVSAALFVAYDLYVYESPLPNYADHAGSGTPWEMFGALFGIWLDQQWGLLTHAPVYVLGLAGLFYMRAGRYRMPDSGAQLATRIAQPTSLKWIMLIGLPYFGLVAQYKYWWGEWCPPARYLTPILPLLVPPLALAVEQVTRKGVKLTWAALSVFGWAVALAFTLDPHLMYNQPLGQSSLLVAVGQNIGADLTAFEPSYILMFLKLDDPTPWLLRQAALTLVWVIALAGLASIGLNAGGWLKTLLTLFRKFPIMPTSSPQEE